VFILDVRSKNQAANEKDIKSYKFRATIAGLNKVNVITLIESDDKDEFKRIIDANG
jgi:hypothetical protein